MSSQKWGHQVLAILAIGTIFGDLEGIRVCIDAANWGNS